MIPSALPFAISLVNLPLIALGAIYGGWWLAVEPIYGWFAMTLLDQLGGLSDANADPAAEERRLFWHKTLVRGWAPLQTLMLVGALVAVAWPGHLSGWECAVLAFGVGSTTGGIGITYAHELVHQRARWERALGEYLLAQVGYAHFATEHILHHHRAVATPGDPVTARLGESLYAFLPRAIVGGFASAWRIERDRLARRGKPVWSFANPFWRYLGGAAAFAALSAAIAGAAGLAFWAGQALVAVLQLEAVDYVEHYGLTRRRLPTGKYEHIRPRHSWNASHRVTNWLLINLQRHSDHHYKPDRRFPLLQTYPSDQAPQLPWGYPLMILIAYWPPAWRRIMDPRVAAWRARHYPDVPDWRAHGFAFA